jgi:transposase
MAEDVGGGGLNERLVVGMGRSGKRRRFDSQAKRELVQACLRPGVSVARMALEHGLNANLLRKWIRQHQRERGDAAAAAMAGGAMSAFVPVVAVSRDESAHPKRGPTVELPTHSDAARALPCTPALPRLMAELPNGVTLRLECALQDATLVAVMIEALGRCDVPARR